MLDVETLHGCTGAFPRKEVGIQMLEGLRAPSSQTAGSLIEPLVYRAGWQNPVKSWFGEFTSIEKYTKLLFIELIRQSKKFDKPSYYHSIVCSHHTKNNNLPKIFFLSLFP
jgi:hypothetical protein